MNAMKESYIPSALIVYLAVNGLLHATANARAKREMDDLIFGSTKTIRLILISLILGFTCGAVYVSLTQPPILIGAVIFGLIAAAGTFAFPSKIVASRISVCEIKWWGSRTEIRWNDVDRIEYHQGPSTTVVRSKSGGRVVHSGWNRDTKGFLTLCEQRTGLSATISEM